MRISFDEPTGDAILAAILAAEWWQEADQLQITAKIDWQPMIDSINYAMKVFRDLAEWIKEWEYDHRTLQ
jgi:hypothetical protein